MIKIDGSWGEGGGQILKSYLIFLVSFCFTCYTLAGGEKCPRQKV